VAAPLFAPVLLLLAAAGADAPTAAPAAPDTTAPVPAVTPPASAAPPPAPAAPPPAAPPPAVGPGPTTEEAQQDLEARLIQLQREVEGLQKQRAAWEDMRRALDELGPRVDELSHRVEQPPAQSRPSPLRNPSESSRFFRNGDGSTWLRPEVRLQAGYSGTLAPAGPGEKAPPVTCLPPSMPPGPGVNSCSTFLIQHAELQFEGSLLQRRFEYRLLFDFIDPQYLKDAFVQWRHGNWIAVRVGQYKLPFGFQRYLRSTYYDFVDLSETMTAFSVERDIGVMVLGRPLGGRLQYQLTVTNGAGAGKLNDNRDLAYTARVVAAPWGALPDSEGDLVGQPRPLVSIGAAGYFNLLPTDVILRTGNSQAITDLDGNGRIDNVAVWQGAVELRVHFRGAALQAEFFHRLEHPGADVGDRTFRGEYLQASYFVIPHFLAVDARVERTDLPLYGATLAQRNASGHRIDGQTAGVSAFVRGHDLKFQADYTHLHTDGVVLPMGTYSPNSHRLRVTAQLMF
jgi:hypothetical protein